MCVYIVIGKSCKRTVHAAARRVKRKYSESPCLRLQEGQNSKWLKAADAGMHWARPGQGWVRVSVIYSVTVSSHLQLLHSRNCLFILFQIWLVSCTYLTALSIFPLPLCHSIGLDFTLVQAPKSGLMQNKNYFMFMQMSKMSNSQIIVVSSHCNRSVT